MVTICTLNYDSASKNLGMSVLTNAGCLTVTLPQPWAQYIFNLTQKS